MEWAAFFVSRGDAVGESEGGSDMITGGRKPSAKSSSLSSSSEGGVRGGGRVMGTGGGSGDGVEERRSSLSCVGVLLVIG